MELLGPHDLDEVIRDLHDWEIGYGNRARPRSR